MSQTIATPIRAPSARHVAHGLRNYLNGVQMGMDSLKILRQNTAEFREICELIEHQTAEATELVEGFFRDSSGR
jgi:hypothetical protein